MKRTSAIRFGVAGLVLALVIVLAYLYRQGQKSQSREWAAYAETALKQDPTLAYLLAEKAYESHASIPAANMLFEAYDRGPFYRTLPGGNLTVAADGKHFLTRTARNEITLWDERFEALKVIPFEPNELENNPIRRSPNGDHFAIVESGQISFYDFLGNAFGVMGLSPSSGNGDRYRMDFSYNGMRFLLSDRHTHTIRLYDLSAESEKKLGIDGFYLTRFSAISPNGDYVKIELQPEKLASGRIGNTIRILNQDLETVFTTTANRGDAFSFVSNEQVVFSNRLAESSSPYANRLVLIHLPDLNTTAIEEGKGRYNFRNFSDFSRAVFQVGSRYFLFHNQKGDYVPLGEVPENWYFREGLSDQKVLVFESVAGNESAVSDFNGRLIHRMQGKLSYVDPQTGRLLLQQKFVTRLFTPHGDLIRKIDAPFYEAGLLDPQYLIGESRTNDEERWMNSVRIVSYLYEKDLRLDPVFRNDFHPIQLDVAANGSLIMATDDRNQVRILDARGELVKEIKAESGPFFYAQFLADGERVLTITQQRELTLWDVSGRPLFQSTLNSPDEALSGALAVNEEEQLLYVVSTERPSVIQVVDFQGKDQNELTGAAGSLRYCEYVEENVFGLDDQGNLYLYDSGEEAATPVPTEGGGPEAIASSGRQLACLLESGEKKSVAVMTFTGDESSRFEVPSRSNYLFFPVHELIYTAEVEVFRADYYVGDRKEQLQVRYPTSGQAFQTDGTPYQTKAEDLLNLEKHLDGYLISYLERGQFYAGIVDRDRKLMYKKSTKMARMVPGQDQMICLDDDQLLYFPTTPEEVIRQVREEKIFGEIRDFTQEEREKYGL